MRKRMMKILIGIAAAAVLLAGGKLMYRHFVTDQILDGSGMINKDAPMLELLSTEWVSEDGVWSACIEGYTLALSYQQNLVYSGNFYFDFDGDDLNVKTELQLFYLQFEREDGSVSSTIESLYVENCRMYLDITVSKEGADSMRQQAVLDRVEPIPEGEPEMLDGDHTYVDNDELFPILKGDWQSTDGRWGLTITESDDYDAHMVLTQDGETAMECGLSYTYLLPRREPHDSTALNPERSSWQLTDGDGNSLGELIGLSHEDGEGNGTLAMTLNREDETETVELYKCETAEAQWAGSGTKP